MANKKNQDRNFIGGSGKEFIFPDGGQIINCFINFDDLAALPRTDKGYIRFVLAERKEPDQFKNTHFFYEDTFVPDSSKSKKDTNTVAESSASQVEDSSDGDKTDDLPF